LTGRAHLPTFAAMALNDSIPTKRRHFSLPPNLPPRMLSREEAAAYCGVSPTLFDAQVAQDILPQGVWLGGRKLWDVRKLDKALDALSGEAESDDPYAMPAA
jgi:hypothetical protein